VGPSGDGDIAREETGMNWRRLRLKYWTDFFERKQLDKDLDDELQAYLDIDIQQRIDRGEKPDEARTAALREVRSVAMVRDLTRESWTSASIDRGVQDVRYALRILRKSPMFAAVVVLSLAIGIGANASFFSLIDAVMLRKLPLDGANELVFFDWTSGPNRLALDLTGTYSKDPATGQQVRTSFTYPTFKAFRERSQTLADVLAFYPLSSATVIADGQPESVPGQLVSGNYYGALRVPMVAGRPMTDADDQGANPVAVISYRYWKRRFNQDQGAVGKQIVLNGVPLTIIGVTKDGFEGTLGFGNPVDISAPLGLEPRLTPAESLKGQSWVWWLRVMGRTKPGIGYPKIQAELQAMLISTGLEAYNAVPPSQRPPNAPDMPTLRVQPGGGGLTDVLNNMGPNGWRASQFLIPIAAISAALLLIVCVNLANLLLARTSAREHEINIRLALGASRERVLRQILTETVLLSLAGGLAGAIAAYWGKDLLLAFLPPSSVAGADVRIDARVLGFTALAAIISGLLLGLAPALRATRESRPALTESGRSVTATRTGLSKMLLVAQVAMSLVLLVGAGLFVRTLHSLRNVNVGFNANNLLLFRVNPGALNYNDARAVDLYREMLDRMRALPGVLHATFSDYPLLTNSGTDMTVVLKGTEPAQHRLVVPRLRVEPSFLESLGIPIVAGRSLKAQDTAATPRVAVVNETFVRRLLQGRNPVGERFGSMMIINGSPASIELEIVGVAKDVSIKIAREDVPPAVYLPYAQSIPGAVTFAVRTSGDPLQLASAIRETAREIDSTLPVTAIRTQARQIEQGFASENMFATASTFFGIVALILACIGLYGLMSYNVERRIAEIGIRMALGARRFDVVHMVMRQTLTLVVAGAALGIVVAFALTDKIAQMLFRVMPHDPVTLSIAVVVLITVGSIAAYVPARRAARADPTAALKCE
jgi:predicted permease